MFVQLTYVNASGVPCTEKNPVEEAMRDHILDETLFQWQSSPEARQEIIGRANIIPCSHVYYNGLQHIKYELEHQDLKDIFRRFKRNRRAAVPCGASPEEKERALAELHAVYRLLRAAVREEE